MRVVLLLIWAAVLPVAAAAQPIIVPLSPQRDQQPPTPPPSPAPVAPPQAAKPQAGAGPQHASPDEGNAASGVPTSQQGAPLDEQGGQKPKNPER
ncbi:MAG: hypothetical protein JOZ17_14765 [Acetobacteraceae bacterium]|nr:hypothetical protein [Acetobacteraceae bacterium]